MKELRTFDGIGQGKCRICGTSDEGKVILIGIDGTASDGNEQAEPIHIGCLNLRIKELADKGIIYQQVEKK